MIDASGRIVEFYLSPEGRKALRGLVPARGPLEALVIATDDLGPLVRVGASGRRVEAEEGVPVMLLRWDYIGTMTFTYPREGEPERAPIGFRGS
jgi:hypothetical protein